MLLLEHALARRGRERPVSRLGELALHELLHLRDDKQRDGLTLADATHAEGALREVAEDHILAERQRGARVERVFDVHARRVDLVVKGEALLYGNAALGELEDAPGRLDQDHLLVALVEKDDAFAPPAEAVREEVVRDALVAHARDQRACVNECVELRLSVGDVAE